MTAKRWLRCAALLLAAWQLIGQNLVMNWSCYPWNDGAYPSGCVDDKYTTNGTVFSTMNATCTGGQTPVVGADAWAYGCEYPQYISASTIKYSDAISSSGLCSCCTPQFQEWWACGGQWVPSGGCTGGC